MAHGLEELRAFLCPGDKCPRAIVAGREVSTLLCFLNVQYHSRASEGILMPHRQVFRLLCLFRFAKLGSTRFDWACIM